MNIVRYIFAVCAILFPYALHVHNISMLKSNCNSSLCIMSNFHYYIVFICYCNINIINIMNRYN